MKLLRSAACTFMVLAAVSVSAQTRYIDQVFTDVTKTSNVVYGWNWSVLPTGEDTTGTAFGPVTVYVDSLVADVYTPTGDSETDRPVILLSHAGSFLPSSFTGLPLGTKSDSCMIELCTRFAKMGYVAVSFDYRLGWNPLAGDQETRAKTIILAVYKAMQDAKALVRYMKANSATYGIDETKVVLGGSNSGAYVALIANVLDKPEEIEQAKFLDSLGNSFIDTTLWGNYDGFGGAINNENTPGESSDFQLCLSLGGDVGDTSWVDAGENPIIAFHGVADAGSPYETAVVIVAATQQPVIEVSGPGDFIPVNDALGNQDAVGGIDACDYPASTDGTVYDGNYPFYGAGFEPWGWYSSTTPLNPNASRTRAYAYIDTIMSYFAPRAYKVLIDNNFTSTNPCLGVEDLKINDVNVEVYPNPSSVDINIRVNDATQTISSVELFDIAGKLVRSEAVKQTQNYTLSKRGVEPGVYFVNIQFTSGDKTFKRVVFE